MGSRGPVPKRTEVRRRRNKDESGAVTRSPQIDVPADVPPPDPEWHEIAVDWYLSLAKSGQSHWYEPSDWATARYVAEAMSRNLKQGQRMSAQMFAAVMSAMTELLTTEGARRRARMEIDRTELAEDASVTAIDEYRKLLG